MKKSCVIDASVVAKWLLADESSFKADILKDDFRDKEIEIYIPSLLFYEVNNLLKSATLSGRINGEKAQEFYSAFLKLNFIVYDSKKLLEAALKMAIDLNISSYDGSYIALAEYLNIPFYTADENLVKKAKSKLVKSITKY
ncbi:MAG: type II toxin-antitoxin system VapC family toxin [Patescibacteria group bacterium]